MSQANEAGRSSTANTDASIMKITTKFVALMIFGCSLVSAAIGQSTPPASPGGPSEPQTEDIVVTAQRSGIPV